MYIIEKIQTINGDGFFFQIVKSTNTESGKVDYRAIMYDDCGDQLDMMPIYVTQTLDVAVSYAENQI